MHENSKLLLPLVMKTSCCFHIVITRKIGFFFQETNAIYANSYCVRIFHSQIIELRQEYHVIELDQREADLQRRKFRMEETSRCEGGEGIEQL